MTETRIDERWYVTFGGSSSIADVIVRELTEKTVLLEFHESEKNQLALFGIETKPTYGRFLSSRVNYIERVTR